MKTALSLLLLLFSIFFSCKKEGLSLKEIQKKEYYKQKQVFEQINEAWFFAEEEFSPEVQQKIIGWVAWRNFVFEITSKPQSSLGAFQKRSNVLVEKVIALNQNIPPEFNKPQVKARITVLTAKLKSLDLYINLNKIPVKKVLLLIDEINADISSLQFQMENIQQRNALPVEAGEDYIKIKDTARAIK